MARYLVTVDHETADGPTRSTFFLEAEAAQVIASNATTRLSEGRALMLPTDETVVVIPAARVLQLAVVQVAVGVSGV